MQKEDTKDDKADRSDNPDRAVKADKSPLIAVSGRFSDGDDNDDESGQRRHE
jgi:hypothetical protein